MDEKLGRDIVNGRLINWDKLSKEELEKLEKELDEKEKEIRKEIDKLLGIG